MTTSCTYLESGRGEHVLGDTWSCNVVDRHHAVDMVAGEMGSDGEEERSKIEWFILVPETDADRAAGSQDTVCLAECILAPAPDPVDRDDGIEGLWRPRQVEHRPVHDLAVRVSFDSDVEQSCRSVDAGDVGAEPAQRAEGGWDAARLGEVRRDADRSSVRR